MNEPENVIIVFFSENYEWIISLIITIIGFVVTSNNIKKGFANEVKKIKQEVAISTMQDIPYEMFSLMESMSENLENKSIRKQQQKKYTDIMAKILCYGSKDTIKIATFIQQCSYGVLPEAKTHTILVLYSLIIAQIKLDLTGVIISPESYFEIKITDYETIKDNVINEANRLVLSLGLNKEFLIK